MVSRGPRRILASGSVTRRALMQAAGLDFTVSVPDVDERAIKRQMQAVGATAEQAALALADAKASGVADPDAVVIGADQILVCEAAWFDKPPDMEAARAQLLHLRGRPHDLVTAVTCWRDGATLWHHIARPILRMRQASQRFIDEYLTAEGEAILSSVGCYRLEGLGVHLFEAVEGEHAAILGLPLLPLLGFLRTIGVVAA